jgi:YggT family protein
MFCACLPRRSLAKALGACRANSQRLHVGHQRKSIGRGRSRPTETGMIALLETIILALSIYWWLIILSAIFSWLYAFNVVNPRNQFVATIGNFLNKVTEPALRPLRRLLPDLGGIDISPIIVLLLIFFAQNFIRTTLIPMFY